MTDTFDAGWLALREPLDALARANAATEQAVAWARRRGGDALTVADLGAGTGSNLRFLAPRLPGPQRWRLIDQDGQLLADAVRRAVPPSGAIDIAQANLASLDPQALAAGHHLITASALFDLVSQRWCETLIAAIAKPGRALLAALTYDGRMVWQPALPDDALITDLVNRHQTRDKGFGAAMGPAASCLLAAAARAHGAAVTVAASDWRIGPANASLHAALLAMLADAAMEQSPADGARIDAWRAARLANVGSARLTVGHIDVFAAWSGQDAGGRGLASNSMSSPSR
ncbi:MAG: class I SAM-dependent methyltransferase [Rhodospirillales bacterium]|nr:class I SAM-dependent methyltransferase [Rhodospirillales bacterium]